MESSRRVNTGYIVGRTDSEAEMAPGVPSAPVAAQTWNHLRQAPSGVDATPLFASRVQAHFPGSPGETLAFRVDRFRMFANGLEFALTAAVDSAGEVALNGLNMSGRVRPGDGAKVTFSVAIEDRGVVLINDARSLRHTPDDPDAPWLHCAGSFGNATQVGAHYFLSPRLDADLTFILEYPEIGVGRRTVTISIAELSAR